MSLSADELLTLIQAAQSNSQNVEGAGRGAAQVSCVALLQLQAQDLTIAHNSLNQTFASATSQAPNLQPSYNIDFSLLDPALVSQVRSEYLAQKSSNNAPPAPKAMESSTSANDNLEAAKSITPEVLVRLSQLAKDTDLLTVLHDMQEEQHNREKEMWSRREKLKGTLDKEREHLLASHQFCLRDMIGIDVTKELEELDTKIANEMKRFDHSIIRDMDRQKKRQEEELIKLQVPFFHKTQDPVLIKLQAKVFKILLDMMDT
ncbi:hypothetical protein INT43_000996 [Umbelopsis isabellina]|uniref:Uncharacterized protein n=1 Tax=Mortierella isabellina TaxID=91625 RepID=A0A8H7Q4D2_MORIS|nr:hypothetical protein INT43_000996 [Umbelopsis isabellina]